MINVYARLQYVYNIYRYYYIPKAHLIKKKKYDLALDRKSKSTYIYNTILLYYY